jgi:hypothetical protein
MTVKCNPALLEELARVFAEAALDQLLREIESLQQGKGPDVGPSSAPTEMARLPDVVTGE